MDSQLFKYVNQARLDFNTAKNKIKEVTIRGTLYDVYEFDLSDLLVLDSVNPDDGTPILIEQIIALILLAIPVISIETVFSLTRAEAINLASIIYATIGDSLMDYKHYQENIN